jgi:hypothetical protein
MGMRHGHVAVDNKAFNQIEGFHRIESFRQIAIFGRLGGMQGL